MRVIRNANNMNSFPVSSFMFLSYLLLMYPNPRFDVFFFITQDLQPSQLGLKCKVIKQELINLNVQKVVVFTKVKVYKVVVRYYV